MCCFCLHLSDFNVLFFQKNKKLVTIYFFKNSCFAKREKKITCRVEKYQPTSPPGYHMVHPLFVNLHSKVINQY